MKGNAVSRNTMLRMPRSRWNCWNLQTFTFKISAKRCFCEGSSGWQNAAKPGNERTTTIDGFLFTVIVSAIRSARGFDGDGGKPHSFFSLRTMRVVTRTSANLSTNYFWIADQRVAGGFQGCECCRTFSPISRFPWFELKGARVREVNDWSRSRRLQGRGRECPR
jgi:hypothetical protein